MLADVNATSLDVVQGLTQFVCVVDRRNRTPVPRRTMT